MKLALLGIICLAFVAATAQEAAERDKAEALDCAFHRKGTWIDSSLRPEGKVRFTYLLEPASNENPRTMYVAFWNATQTEGRLLEFHLSKTPEHKDAVAIANEGSIWDNNGQPDIRDLQGGLYVYQHVKDRLPKLKAQHATVLAIDQMKKTSAVCSSPLDYFKGKDAQKSETVDPETGNVHLTIPVVATNKPKH
jgi:hypothetical protein